MLNFFRTKPHPPSSSTTTTVNVAASTQQQQHQQQQQQQQPSAPSVITANISILSDTMTATIMPPIGSSSSSSNLPSVVKASLMAVTSRGGGETSMPSSSSAASAPSTSVSSNNNNNNKLAQTPTASSSSSSQSTNGSIAPPPPMIITTGASTASASNTTITTNNNNNANALTTGLNTSLASISNHQNTFVLPSLNANANNNNNNNNSSNVSSQQRLQFPHAASSANVPAPASVVGPATSNSNSSSSSSSSSSSGSVPSISFRPPTLTLQPATHMSQTTQALPPAISHSLHHHHHHHHSSSTSSTTQQLSKRDMTIRSKLNDAKAFLENEKNQLRLNIDPPSMTPSFGTAQHNSRPPILVPINSQATNNHHHANNNNNNNHQLTNTSTMNANGASRRDILKSFDFRQNNNNSNNNNNMLAAIANTNNNNNNNVSAAADPNNKTASVSSIASSTSPNGGTGMVRRPTLPFHFGDMNGALPAAGGGGGRSPPTSNSDTLALTATHNNRDLVGVGLPFATGPASSRSSSVSSQNGGSGSGLCINGLNNSSTLSSASSSSFSASQNSQNSSSRLEAVNADKYKEIMRNTGYLIIGNQRVKTSMDDLTPECELGSGTSGHVIKMRHNQSGELLAVKQMRISGIAEENRRIIMDLDVVLKCSNCKEIVKCLGYLISESDVWICMELMSMCFDKLFKLTNEPIPEPILGKLTVSTLKALNYLKENHSLIHRDIKPSNILIDINGNIKLCDFGISGNLINSNALSRNNAGCAGYMAPERIDPIDPHNPVYDIRADVWSLGITLVELAKGKYPYKHCQTEFEVMTTILTCDAPRLEGAQFTEHFKSFVNQCLVKDFTQRPKYAQLLEHPFVQYYKQCEVDVRSWFRASLAKNKQKMAANGGLDAHNTFEADSCGGGGGGATSVDALLAASLDRLANSDVLTATTTISDLPTDTNTSSSSSTTPTAASVSLSSFT